MKLFRVLKETFLASLPLAAIIIIVCCFVAPMTDSFDYIKLIIGYAGVVVGQSIFLVGLDISILPIGKAVGESLSKLKKVVFIVFFGFLFGFIAESAEPALTVFARQTSHVMSEISEKVLIVVMAAGIGALAGFALYRILKDISIKVVFAVLYAVVFLLAIFIPSEFVGIAFDGSGATTGDISVPFMLALGFGVAATVSRHKSNDDSFGIVGLASIGPILSVFIYGIIFKVSRGGVIPEAGSYTPEAVESFASVALFNLHGVFFALAPIILVFLPFQFFLIKLYKKDFVKLLLGMIPVFAGLFIFLTCVDYGFAYAGKYIGTVFFDASRPEWFKWLLLAVGFVLGGGITLSEPAVTVLGHQLEEITNGHIKQMTIRLTLAIGLGFASVLAIIKMITQINLLWFLIPLYIVAICMMKFSSKMFVGLAFDSGGVTAGGLTSAFLTPFALGIALAVRDLVIAAGGTPQSILINGFGIISFMSVVPLIAVQTLGIIYESRYKKQQILADQYELETLETLTPLYNEAANGELDKSDILGQNQKGE
ncbi:MAG: DUF1538 domain-containing protein [Syntrophobacterales bacterium]|jgi:hypothetical protein|nr:DUF1538 domain-containing protein [Syntrophobacterales bacterium]